MSIVKSTSKVRLNEEYLKTIKLLAKKYFDSENVKIFGSRANLEKKGGDIDIYINTVKTEGILSSKIAFLRDFEKKHGEQKVDLIVESGIYKNKKIETSEKLLYFSNKNYCHSVRPGGLVQNLTFLMLKQVQHDRTLNFSEIPKYIILLELRVLVYEY